MDVQGKHYGGLQQGTRHFTGQMRRLAANAGLLLSLKGKLRPISGAFASPWPWNLPPPPSKVRSRVFSCRASLWTHQFRVSHALRLAFAL